MATFFDDGSNPRSRKGSTDPVERVLVVGAGIAGLTVANAMAHAGVDCVVLEARRPGRWAVAHRGPGRIPGWTSAARGCTTRSATRCASSPRTVGIACKPANPLPTLSAFDCATGLWLSHAEVEASLVVELEGFTEALGGLRTRLGPGASAAEGIESYLATTDLTDEPLRRARQGLRASVEADTGAAGEHQSLEWLWTQEEYDGDYFGVQPEGGYGSGGGDAMAAGLDVRQDWPVARVDLSDGGVAVTSASGKTEAGSHVVVAVPLGALKSDLPRLGPGRFPDKRAPEAVGRLGFGRYEKVALNQTLRPTPTPSSSRENRYSTPSTRLMGRRRPRFQPHDRG